MKESFERIVNRRLDSLNWDGKTESAMARIQARLEKEVPAPRKRLRRSTVLALGFAVVLLAATAFAVVELVFSRDYTVERTAREAVMEKYGLTDRTMGMFIPYIKETDDGWTVTFTPSIIRKSGTYTVTVPKSGETEAAWTHDGVNRAEWEGGDLSAEIWGQRQIEAYMDARAGLATGKDAQWKDQWELDFDVNADNRTLAQRAADDEALEKAMPEGQTLYRKNVLPGPDDLSEAEAVRVAEQKVKEIFAISAEALETHGYVRKLSLWKDGDENEAKYDIAWRNREGEYVTVSFTASGKDVKCHASSFPGGKLPNRPLEESDWKAVAAYIDLGGLDALSDAERAEVVGRIRGAGLGELLKVEDADDTPGKEAAIAAAATAIKQAYGLTEDMLALFRPAAEKKTEAERTVWEVAYSSIMDYGDPYHWGASCSRPDDSLLGVYTALVDEQSGDVLKTAWSLEGMDGGGWTRENWGQAKAYGTDVLPWFEEFARARSEIAAKYWDEVNLGYGTTSVEDNAAVDQLLRDAGFDAARYNHVLPGEKDLTQEQAWDLFARVMNEEYGVTREQMDASGVAYADLTQEGDHREWYFWIQNEEAQESWSIVLDAGTGEVLKLIVDSFASGNG